MGTILAQSARPPVAIFEALARDDQYHTTCHSHLAAVGWVLRGYSEQYSGFQTVIVLFGLPILKGNDGLGTRVPSLRPRDVRGQ